MGWVPLTISIHKFTSSVGADAGFAALIGLAILVLLYFAQARETATLREQAAEAADRVDQLEARVAELARPGRRAQPAQAVQAGQSPVQPAAAPVAAGIAAPGAVAAPSRFPIGAPAGVAAPALAAATRLIPLPTDNGAGGDGVAWPGEPIAVHRGGAAPTVPPATVAGGNGTASHDRLHAVTSIPRRRIDPAPLGGSGRSSAGPRRAPIAPEPPPRQRSGLVTVLAGVLGLLVLAAAIAAVLILTHNGSSHSPKLAARSTNAAGTRVPVAINPHAVTVAVLNGTGTTGLAHRTAQRLTSAGYHQGAIATATDQTHTATQVAYLPGFKPDAVRVASALKLPSASVQPIDPGTRAVACPPPAACGVNVVVTVGSDLASVY